MAIELHCPKAPAQSDAPGFTLLELLITIAISMLALGAIYSTFRSQQNSYLAQEQQVRMQQNLRAAMFYIARELRMAGCNPTGAATPTPGFSVTKAAEVAFTMDVTDDDEGTLPNLPDGKTDGNNENVAYSLDAGVRELKRNTGGGNQTVAENIEVVDFVYLDSNGQVLNPGRTDVTSEIQRRNITGVEITMVARSTLPIRNMQNNRQYFNQRGDLLVSGNGDPFMRRSLTTVVECRNL
jgi:type IV pilus assembly protein PilW